MRDAVDSRVCVCLSHSVPISREAKDTKSITRAAYLPAIIMYDEAMYIERRNASECQSSIIIVVTAARVFDTVSSRRPVGMRKGWERGVGERKTDAMAMLTATPWTLTVSVTKSAHECAL